MSVCRCAEERLGRNGREWKLMKGGLGRPWRAPLVGSTSPWRGEYSPVNTGGTDLLMSCMALIFFLSKKRPFAERGEKRGAFSQGWRCNSWELSGEGRPQFDDPKWRKGLLDEHERGEWTSWLKTQHSQTKIMASGPITSWQIDGKQYINWSQDCWEKYQQPQICRWYHSNGKKWRGSKKPLDESERRVKKFI